MTFISPRGSHSGHRTWACPEESRNVQRFPSPDLYGPQEERHDGHHCTTILLLNFTGKIWEKSPVTRIVLFAYRIYKVWYDVTIRQKFMFSEKNEQIVPHNFHTSRVLPLEWSGSIISTLILVIQRILSVRLNLASSHWLISVTDFHLTYDQGHLSGHEVSPWATSSESLEDSSKGRGGFGRGTPLKCNEGGTVEAKLGYSMFALFLLLYPDKSVIP